MENQDVIIVGGSFAGLSAAMQLVRARKRVLLIDAGQPRNRFSPASHGFLGQDGVAPTDIRRTALSQLARYPSFTLCEGEATSAARIDAGFELQLADGRSVFGRRLILAVGVRDELPAVKGLGALWGKSVLHCPYCHGYEIGCGPIGILASSPLAAHQAALLPDWGYVTAFLQPGVEFAAEDADLLARRGVLIEREPIVELLSEGDALKGAELVDGRRVLLRALFVQPKVAPASALAADLGARMAEGPQGPYIEIDDWGSTSIPGLFAAGDASSPMHNATLASAAGLKAGIMAHRSLVLEG